jgi:hypothetical protein
VLLARETFASLARVAELFEELVIGQPGLLDAFWRNAAEAELLPELRANPNLCVAIGMHGDDAGVYQIEKVLVLTWGSVALALY